MGLISSITSWLSGLAQGAQVTSQAAGTAYSAWSWFTGLHLSGTALLIIAALLILLGGKIAKGIIYIIAFILIIMALASFGLI